MNPISIILFLMSIPMLIYFLQSGEEGWAVGCAMAWGYGYILYQAEDSIRYLIKKEDEH